MKINIFHYVSLSLFLLSCGQAQKSNEREIERTTAEVQIVSDTLITSMPGNLLVYENELVWMDARLGEVHVVNKENGAEIKVLSMMGGGTRRSPNAEYLLGSGQKVDCI